MKCPACQREIMTGGCGCNSITFTPITPVTPQGWQCPVCKVVRAPWVAFCDCVKEVK
jgi:hypothetical protein